MTAALEIYIAEYNAPAPVPLPLQPGEWVVATAVGRAHSVLVTSKGRALSLGSNSYSQCGAWSRFARKTN